MQPISILGPGAGDLAGTLAERLEGRVAVVRRDESPDESNERGHHDGDAVGDTTLSLSSDGSWTGRGTVDGFDAILDRLAPDHDYLVAVGLARLRVPAVLLGDDADPDETPGNVLARGAGPEDVDVDALLTALAGAEPWITRELLVDRVERSADAERSGAIATFTGRVRARDAPDDERTTHLAFEKYEGVARERMDAIAAELTDREGVFEVAFHHRTGVIESGEDIVFVVVLAGHRAEAFRAVEDGIDRLKDEVPIFKKETTESEEFWLHQRS
ncbi:molybdopterin synthase [Halorubrum cibi]|uniref:Molybdopterin synthase subunit MoaE /molybdopterin guanine dinucleotide biosynthesis accessory protein MobB n=1 Tax=Halorubrum cibi TaxID=413815 RepID=A0A521CF08_9EURY|nr:molybdopterin synthase [Halorubrum cibi]SMO57965.1 molybdopterin synthase subunit MoaE /molybdopterin guanine dinucleotide biosynthesis accessory protein MobB [Halorubrum cibi]